MRFFGLFVILLGFQAWADDFTRQLHSDDLNAVMLGEQVHYTYEVDAKTPLPIGVSWLFVTDGKGKLSFAAARRLADELSHKGWHVVMVSPSWMTSSPAVTSAQSQNNENIATDPIQPWQSVKTASIAFPDARAQLQSFLPQLVDLSRDKAGFRMFIAEGMAASLLLALGQDLNTPIPDALTIVSPFWPEATVNDTLPELSAQYPAPVLDVAYSSSNNWSRATNIARLIQANVQIKMHYRQRQLPRLVGRQAADWLSGEIVGWTRSLGW
ncbi:DUF3530 family protein [Alteromonas sediminis]|uniref:DUF3530 family protein n=1 Tax=Alteromonas sediminis TaxID=2259342 RepID=A0A3N5Y6E6_9ALTE|nr:DUF3530 family protein [Alteromonas sediminis]RPJ66029.1 DUF3530 family protein [Alteromonas sediminis]